MIKKFLEKFDLKKCKAFFARIGKKLDPRKIKKPSFSFLKKIKLPPALKKAGAKIKVSFGKKAVARLSVALCAVTLSGVLIFWDMGVIELPFLTRKDRRSPLQTEIQGDGSSTTTTSKSPVSEEQSYSPAVNTIRALYAFAGVNVVKTPVTALPYKSDEMTITKQILPEGSFSTSMGFVVKTVDGSELLFTAPDAQEILDSEGYHLTHYRTMWGDAVFTKDGTEGFFCFDAGNRSFYPIAFDPAFYPHASFSFALPRSYGQADAGTELFLENGLYGYRGSYQDGKRTKNFTVDPIYPTAFAYSEGFAVMADQNGKVTIRNAHGEEVFTQYDLILPDYKDREALGFYYFDGGVLRVIVAGYDDAGNLTSRRETMINTRGQEVSLPEGYRVVSLHEEILLVTDGEFFGHLSANGAWISPPVYTSASPFFEGLATVTDKSGKTGLIDKSGKTVMPCAFDLITDFSDGNALCYSPETGWYLLTKVAGIYYLDPDEESITHTKVSLTRGPQNTFDYEPDEVIELTVPESTPPRTTRPENTTEQTIK